MIKRLPTFTPVAVLALGAFLSACGGSPSDAPMPTETTRVDMGPTEYDASGSMPCSAGAATFDQACGWRVVRDGTGGAEIWISNIASATKPAYRVLRFSEGEFTDRGGDPVQVSKDTDMWVIRVGQEHYKFADALITGG